jgi:hypothetical protein
MNHPMKHAAGECCSATFDGVVRDPIDFAAASMFFKGVKPPQARTGCMWHWEICPPIHTKRMTRELYRRLGEDLTGRRQGRMTVVGASKDLPARWIMRCDCGDYEPRSSKAVKNPNNSQDCCAKCRQIGQAIRHHQYHTTGKNPPTP